MVSIEPETRYTNKQTGTASKTNDVSKCADLSKHIKMALEAALRLDQFCFVRFVRLLSGSRQKVRQAPAAHVRGAEGGEMDSTRSDKGGKEQRGGGGRTGLDKFGEIP